MKTLEVLQTNVDDDGQMRHDVKATVDFDGTTVRVTGDLAEQYEEQGVRTPMGDRAYPKDGQRFWDALHTAYARSTFMDVRYKD